MEISDRISKLLRESGLRQKEFANKIGVTEAQVSSWKTGRNEPDTDNLVKIAEYFGVSVKWLRTGLNDNRQFPPNKVSEDGLPYDAPRFRRVDSVTTTPSTALQDAINALQSLLSADTDLVKSDLELIQQAARLLDILISRLRAIRSEGH